MFLDGLPLLQKQENWVGIIGSRKASVKEHQVANYLAQRCIQKGKIVVSGLAVNIDTSAHVGALSAGGLTVAIVNTSKNEPIYPRENQSLAEKIKKNGCILYPYDTPSQKSTGKGFNQFQKRLIERDLLLAFLCPVIVVVKDGYLPIDGGTKWAVSYGIKWGKKVFRLDSDFKFHEKPPVEQCKINWKMELQWNGLQL